MKIGNLLRALLLIASLLAVLTAPAQSRRGRYKSITFEHFNPDSSINESTVSIRVGTLSVAGKKIWIDSASRSGREIWFINNLGKLEHADDGGYIRDMLIYGIDRRSGVMMFTHAILSIAKDKKTITDVSICRPYNRLVCYTFQ